jgi:hypothetical protein
VISEKQNTKVGWAKPYLPIASSNVWMGAYDFAHSTITGKFFVGNHLIAEKLFVIR